ncbi:hypothetical protein LZ31DRAFT_545284 [Colletotrichum somersetense]|nr:hypothetical protein LZ31DRAFT_545284 [Colletotrichum somersetense]
MATRYGQKGEVTSPPGNIRWVPCNAQYCSILWCPPPSLSCCIIQISPLPSPTPMPFLTAPPSSSVSAMLLCPAMWAHEIEIVARMLPAHMIRARGPTTPSSPHQHAERSTDTTRYDAGKDDARDNAVIAHVAADEEAFPSSNKASSLKPRPRRSFPSSISEGFRSDNSTQPFVSPPSLSSSLCWQIKNLSDTHRRPAGKHLVTSAVYVFAAVATLYTK